MEISEDSPSMQQARITSVVRRRKQKFKKEWLSKGDFASWLTADKNDVHKAQCKLCKKFMTAELCVIRTHAHSRTHIRSLSVRGKQTSITSGTPSPSTGGASNATHRAELQLCAFVAEHNISFLAINHLVPVLKSCFPDSQIAQKMQMKKTKATAIIKNVIAVSEKEYLTRALKTNKFSILIDESTDISCNKTMCIVVLT